MAAKPARSRTAAYALGRAGAAALVATISFIALREKYRGECLWIEWNPDPSLGAYEFLFLNFFAVLFLVCFVWLGIELVRVADAVLNSGFGSIRLAAVGAVLACSLYLVVASVTWKMNPIPADDDTTWKGTRLYLSLFWPLGVLQDSGNYRSTFCGE